MRCLFQYLSDCRIFFTFFYFCSSVNSLKRIVDQIGTEKDGPGLLDDL